MYTKKSESIKFKAKAVIYNKADSGFKIIKGSAYEEDGISKICNCAAKGDMYDVEEGDNIFAVGYWETHPEYGKSFKVTSYVKTIPTNPKSILNYLKNGNISGISEAKAITIVDMFGANTLNILINNTELLSNIKGIGKKTIEKIKKSAKENLEKQSIMATIMMYIQGFDISPAYSKKIYEKYGEKSMSVIKKNPYQLADEVKGIGFLKADEIALKNGIEKDSPFRIESAVIYVLKKMSEEGDVFGKTDETIAKCCDFLCLKKEYVEDAIERLIKDKKIIKDDEDLYLPKYYFAETYSAEKLIGLKNNLSKSFIATDDEIQELSKAIGKTYATAQIQAIKTACKSNVTVITGGPGTGKTTVTNGIIKICTKKGMKVLCAAPTGKAAKRLSEATNTDATTIHKLLEMKYDEENKRLHFNKNASNPLEGDVLIVDESSMIDIELFNYLLQAIPYTMKLILVGDIDQLPSVGCGNVLNDIISSGVISVERLSVIFRQAEQSDIVKNAHIINSGHTPDLKNKKDGDFFFIDTEYMSPENIRDRIVYFVSESLPKCYGVEPNEIQVLAPMKKGATGVYELNNFIQNKINPPSKDKPFIMSNGNIFRENDKIMCVSNDYNFMVFNGDIGKIKTIKNKIDDYDDDQNDSEDELASSTYFSVDFGDKEIKFPLYKIDNFMLAYCTTIHKSQGSEYDIVVMPLTNQNYIMLQRNLLYTGLTRAKKVFVLVGQKSAIRTAVHTLKVIKRNTKLSLRLQKE